MKIEIYCENEDCEAELEFDFDPGEAPAACSNPDHPAYSDPGDPGYCDGPDKCPKCGIKLNLERAYEQALEAYIEDERDRKEEADIARAEATAEAAEDRYYERGY
jgi:hypothetical protein